MDTATALEALSALSQETRLATFRLLVRAGSAGLAAGEIAAALGVVQNTLSSHLAVLSRAGLVHRFREGRVIRYSADYAGMRALLTYLLEDCCAGDRKICGPLADTIRCLEA